MFKKMLSAILVVALAGIAAELVAWSQAKSVTVEGYVIDSACSFTKNLDKPISRECALACAKAGSQLVIQTDQGLIYWPIDEKTPASGQNAKLLEYAGGRVKATGKLYDRGGSHALVIERLEAAPAK
ncbi:MAG TPA: hypothetical protein VK525_21145 [Candidatus Saccharimonadales bacterium]|nr:hypothetical protein [Candidatus Saccharimonadales bacterium]